MEYKCSVILTKALILFVLVNCVHSAAAAGSPRPVAHAVMPCAGCSITCPRKATPYDRRGCTNCNTHKPVRCCDGVINDYFQNDQFENLFSNRDSFEAHAKGFWDYHSFIAASAHYQPYGFGTTYINSTFFGTKEVAAFLAHVGTRTSCEYFIVSV